MNKTIVIVDDFQANIELINLILEPYGFSILQANNGIDALSLINKRTVDMIITDYHMPQMNGVELIKTLKQKAEFRKLPVFILSVEHFPEDVKQQVENDTTYWYSKPIDLNRLSQQILCRLSMLN